MISVKEVFEINRDTTVLVCDVFLDSEISDLIRTEQGDFADFEVLPVRECFSKARTRNIVVRGNLDKLNIKNIQFI